MSFLKTNKNKRKKMKNLFFLFLISLGIVGCDMIMGTDDIYYSLDVQYYHEKELLSSKEMTIPEGEDISFPINPDSGYIARRIYDNGVGTPVVEIFSIKNIDSDHLIKIECEKILPTFTVTISQKGIGTVSPSGVVNVTYGESLPISISTNEENLIDSIFVNGVYIAPVDSLNLYSIKEKYDVVVVFRAKKVFTIDISSSEGSKPNPNGLVKVLEGSSLTINNILEYGWSMEKLLLEGKEVSPIDRYQFADIKANHAVRWENKKNPEWYLVNIKWKLIYLNIGGTEYNPIDEMLDFLSDGTYKRYSLGTWRLDGNWKKNNGNIITFDYGGWKPVIDTISNDVMICHYNGYTNTTIIQGYQNIGYK